MPLSSTWTAGAPAVHVELNGIAMKRATMLATLQKLGIASSFSRPSVGNDNPFPEALFRTAKYRLWYPSRTFASLEDAAAWVAMFVEWHNEGHFHSAIRFVTPADRHTGKDVAILENREEVYQHKHVARIHTGGVAPRAIGRDRLSCG